MLVSDNLVFVKLILCIDINELMFYYKNFFNFYIYKNFNDLIRNWLIYVLFSDDFCYYDYYGYFMGVFIFSNCYIIKIVFSY